MASLRASTIQVAWLTALAWTPNLVALPIGVWVDRQRRQRRLLVVADLVCAVALTSIPVMYLLGGVSLPQLYVIVALNGIAATLANTTWPALFVRVVSRQNYLDANSKLSSSLSMAYVLGPALGGLLVQLVSAAGAVIRDAASFVASAVLIARISVRSPISHIGDLSRR